MQLRAHWLAYAAFVVPLAAAHAALAINVHAGLIEACNPYLDGCTSISRAARSGSALYLFRPLMLPYCALLAGFWWLVAAWFAHRADRLPRRVLAAALLGTVAAAFLALYVTYLGEDGESARFMRRYGNNLFFGFTVNLTGASMAHRRTLTALCAVMLVLGIASIPLQHWVDDRGALLNAIEWNYALLMVCVFALIGRIWQRQGFRLEARSD